MLGACSRLLDFAHPLVSWSELQDDLSNAWDQVVDIGVVALIAVVFVFA
jgi:hypothetical protein